MAGASLGLAPNPPNNIDSFGDLEVYPTIMDEGMKVVFRDEFSWDVREFDPDVFWTIERRAQIKVLDVETGKFCAGSGEDTVEEQFDNL